ncbi:hypothetical protein D3C80_1689590 [compost metagenome]
MTDREPRDVPEVGFRCAWQDHLNPHTFVCQLVLKGLGKRQDVCLAAAVNTIQQLRRQGDD